MEAILLRLEAPMMSFGGTSVDHIGPTMSFPGRSLLTGLLANALGYNHSEFHRLGRLQERLLYAVRQDIKGTLLEDFQTVALGQQHMIEGWTTDGRSEHREGANSRNTHIRYRQYLADAVYTVALTLEPGDEAPTLDDLKQAIARPERPLFVGRKPCLPSAPLLLGFRQGSSLLDLLRAEPLVKRRRRGGKGTSEPSDSIMVWWESDDSEFSQSSAVQPVYVDRDWSNQVHVGRRFMRQSRISVVEVGNE